MDTADTNYDETGYEFARFFLLGFLHVHVWTTNEYDVCIVVPVTVATRFTIYYLDAFLVGNPSLNLPLLQSVVGRASEISSGAVRG